MIRKTVVMRRNKILGNQKRGRNFHSKHLVLIYRIFQVIQSYWITVLIHVADQATTLCRTVIVGNGVLGAPLVSSRSDPSLCCTPIRARWSPPWRVPPWSATLKTRLNSSKKEPCLMSCLSTAWAPKLSWYLFDCVILSLNVYSNKKPKRTHPRRNHVLCHAETGPRRRNCHGINSIASYFSYNVSSYSNVL